MKCLGEHDQCRPGPRAFTMWFNFRIPWRFLLCTKLWRTSFDVLYSGQPCVWKQCMKAEFALVATYIVHFCKWCFLGNIAAMWRSSSIKRCLIIAWCPILGSKLVSQAYMCMDTSHYLRNDLHRLVTVWICELDCDGFKGWINISCLLVPHSQSLYVDLQMNNSWLKWFLKQVLPQSSPNRWSFMNVCPLHLRHF